MGSAVADAIFGHFNPSAKSPITFPVSEADVTPPCDRISCPYTEGLYMGWHGMQHMQVLFPFGHGLSYTLFVSARITNMGDVGGVEVAQLYLSFPDGTGEPA